MSQLDVLLNNQKVGTFIQMDTGKHAFEYSDEWLELDNGLPLSLSMPLDIQRFEGNDVTTFFDGLLPDNDEVRKRWGQKFSVSPKNPFELLSHMGRDCPGAIQIVEGKIENTAKQTLLSTRDIAMRLKELREDAAAWIMPEDRGHFSLAGAQRKTAFFFDGKNWYLPEGSTPTTHILKPPIPGFEAQEANECFCLWLASEMGLITTNCKIQTFENERAIVVERFDRYRDQEGGLQRIHMEDYCQASAIPPTRKYQTDGGPNPEYILNLIESCSEPEVDKLHFIEALFFNWLVLGTDAHAKNYSLLLGEGNQVVLAPLYDISSYLPYTNDPEHTNLAMKIMSKNKAGEITKRHWLELIRRSNMHIKETTDRLQEMIEIFPKSIENTVKRTLSTDMPADFIQKLSQNMLDWHKVIKRKML